MDTVQDCALRFLLTETEVLTLKCRDPVSQTATLHVIRSGQSEYRFRTWKLARVTPVLLKTATVDLCSLVKTTPEMPTATTTMTSETISTSSTTSVLSIKASKSLAAESSTAATLRSLYPRAANAFLQRDFSLTQSLLTSAFALIGPPASVGEDELATHRRKWDILRITLETTVYTSPPPLDNTDAFPAALRANQTMSPQAFVNSVYARSLQLFTPSNTALNVNSAYLPYQIIVTLVSAGVKLSCSDISRSIIEDWLARRVPDDSEQSSKGYTKVLEHYCLHVLPRLEEWQYAEDFLQYERELDVKVRSNLVAALHDVHQQVLETRSLAQASLKPPKTPSISPSSSASSRSVSPSPSTSSESSTSTHTATPRTPHPEQKKGKGKDVGRMSLNGLTHLTPTVSRSPPSEASMTTAKTATPESVNKRHLNAQATTSFSHHDGPTPNGHARPDAASPISRPSRASPISPSGVRPPTTLTLIRSYIQTVLRTASKPKLAALFLLFVVFPLLSFFVRVRRRRLITSPGGTAEQVRRRLRGPQGTSSGAAGLAFRIWEEVFRAIGDTIRMGGGGLA